MLVALLPAFQGAKADVAQAIWCSGNKTLYFDYCATVTVGSSYDEQTVTDVYAVPTDAYSGSFPGWSAVREYATTVVFKAAFNSIKPISCYGWFNLFTQLTDVDGLANLNTSQVEILDFMFDSCSSLATLDLSTFDVSKVATAESMFFGCSSLTTIYCNKAWSIASTTSMFRGATQLRGYNDSQVTGTMASPAGYFTATQTLPLNYNTSNETTISDWVTNHKDEYANVTLSEHTLYKDTYWNTLCLPFSMNSKQIAESPLADATIKELDVARTYLDNENNGHQTGFDSKTGTLYLYFKEASSIEAGKPYIVKWGNTEYIVSPENIVSPVFNNVSTDNTASTTVTASNSDLNPVQFIGNYSPVTLTGGDASNLYLGAGNKLYYPAKGKDVTINAFHGYFHVDLGTKAPVRAFVLNFDDEENTTGIISTTNDPMEASGKAEFTNSAGNGWYTLDGRQLGGMPNKGIYIYKGRKVIR